MSEDDVFTVTDAGDWDVNFAADQHMGVLR